MTNPTPEQEAVTLAEKLLEIFQGWQTATFGWQDDPDLAVAAKNYEAAAKAHRDECIRRVLAVLAERDKQHTEELAQQSGVMPPIYTFENDDTKFDYCEPPKVREAIATLQAQIDEHLKDKVALRMALEQVREQTRREVENWRGKVEEICAMYRAPFSKETFAGLIEGMERDLEKSKETK